MYAPPILQAHYDNLEKDFHALFLDFNEEPAGETIHQLRVNIKKQMAFFQLLKTLETHLPLAEIETPYNAFFKSIGKIRNLEIRQSIIAKEEEKLNLPSVYSTKIKTQITNEKEWWQADGTMLSLLPFRNVSNKVQSSIHRMPKDTIKASLCEYFHALITKIHEIVYQEVTQLEQLHDLRKYLKVLYLNLALADQIVAQAVIPAAFYKELETINDQLGDWHDRYITIEKLSAKKTAVDKQVLKGLRKEERIARKKVMDSFGYIYDLTNEIQQAIFQLLAQGESINRRPQKLIDRKKGEQCSSITQKNIGELMK